MPRTLLNDNITLTREDGSNVNFRITEHIGSGASCVVYHAICEDKTEHLLKEYYPLYLDIARSDDGTLVVLDSQMDAFNAGLTTFENGGKRQKDVRLLEKLKNFTSNIQGYYHGNGTVYIDMTCFSGRTYNKVENESLYTLMIRMRTLAKVIGDYHNAGLLHLDIKPENIYVRPEEETAEDVMLFDFDSVVEIEKIQDSPTLSFTKTWAAPEQLLPYKRDSICKATDLFPIGEMIFNKIYGRHSTQAERRSFAKYPLDYEWDIFNNVNPKVFPLIQELFSHTICATPARRYQTAEELMVQLDKIIKLADPHEPYLISTLPVPKSFFIGRDADIEDIHARLQQSPVLFLHGIGGIGKSELAKQYATKYRDEYDTVIWAPYVNDIVSMIADDSYVKINHFECLPDEKIEEYYARKKNKIQALIDGNGDRTLMIVDNFDTAEDPNFEELFNLRCRVIITTRVDFSDDYEQKKLENIANPIAIFNEYYKKPLSDIERDIVNKIIENIGGHTMTVELLSKQMMAGRVTPEQMLAKLKSSGISDSGNEKVRSAKDGKLTMQSTFAHIQALFDLSELDETEKYVLANLSLIPTTGISAELFCEWCEIDNFDIINRLAVEGWVQLSKTNDCILLHPLISDMIYWNIDNSEQVERLFWKATEKTADFSTQLIFTHIVQKGAKIIKEKNKRMESTTYVSISTREAENECGKISKEIQSTLKNDNDNEQLETILKQAHEDYSAERYTAAFRGFERIAHQSIEAKFMLAEIYHFGKGIVKDEKKAIALYEECECAGYLAADCRLAQCWYHGWDKIKSNYTKAMGYAQKGINAEPTYNYQAHYIIGCCALELTNYSVDEAIEHLRLSVDKNNTGYYELGRAYKIKGEDILSFNVFKSGVNFEAKCYFPLAMFYIDGEGVDKDPYTAVQILKVGAEKDWMAKILLAACYIEEIGTQKDINLGMQLCSEVLKEHPEDCLVQETYGKVLVQEGKYQEAIQYFEKAQGLGSSEAKLLLGICHLELKAYKVAADILLSALNDQPENQNIYMALGNCYYNEDSPIKNNQKAISYYKKAAELGDDEAMWLLGGYYARANNEKEAEKYLELAKDNGNSSACTIFGKSEFKKGNIDEAVNLLKDSAKEGISEAQYYLGRCYWDVKFNGCDRDQAIYWLAKAAKNGSKDACLFLAHLYSDDTVLKDENKCNEYLTCGHELGDNSSTFYLAQRYLYKTDFFDEDAGVELLRQLIKKNDKDAKLLLVKYFYKKYHLAITKLGIFDFYDETGADYYLKLIPGIQLIACPIVWVKNKARQVKREQDISQQDMVYIKELVVILKQLADKPEGLSKKDIKMVKTLLNSIKDKYRS